MRSPSPVLKREPHLRELPARPEIARAPLGIGLEAPAGEHHGLGGEIDAQRPLPGADPGDAVLAFDHGNRPRSVGDRHAALLGRLEQRLGQAGAGAVDPDRRPARELDPAVAVRGLPLGERPKPHAVGAQPAHGVGAAVDQELGQLRIAALLGHARHVIEILLPRVGAEASTRALLRGDRASELLDIINTRIHRPHRADREAAVAAALLQRRALQHHDRGALRCRCRRQAGEAGTDHQHIGLAHCPRPSHHHIRAGTRERGAAS